MDLNFGTRCLLVMGICGVLTILSFFQIALFDSRNRHILILNLINIEEGLFHKKVVVPIKTKQKPFLSLIIKGLKYFV